MTAAAVLLVALIAAPLLAPNWRVLGGVSLGLMVVLSLIWAKLGWGDAAPSALAQAFVGIALVGVIGATLGRVIGLRVQSGGQRRWRVLWADALGLALAACVVALPYLYDVRIVNRPPPAACMARPLPVQIGGAKFAVPFSPALALITGEDDRSLSFPPHQRDLCERSNNGTYPVHASALFIDARRDFCKAPAPGWQRDLCQNPRDYPILTVVYDPAGITPQALGIGRPQSGAHPVTDGTQSANCATNGGLAACDADLSRPGGLPLHVQFIANPGHEAETLRRVAANAARMLDALGAQ